MVGFEGREDISKGDFHVVQRAVRSSDRRAVLLKSPRSTPATPSACASLEREFALLRDLSIPGVPQALDLIRASGSPVMVLDDLGSLPLRGTVAPWKVERVLRVGIRLCAILDELHSRNIAYCRLSPDSILADPEGANAALIDFSAALNFGQSTDSASQSIAADFLPYCSPEQTGRVNRAPDYRSDLYSLGTTLYELLLGSPPFQSPDPMELIHWHIAKQPASLRAVDASVPAVVSDIVAKLLAKTPEDRYQSARGLRLDLEACFHQWTARQEITSFPLGGSDVSHHLRIPQRLYGRGQEVRRLAAIFEETCQGRTGMALVAGYSGVGKTALVQELYRPIVRQRGYFISGKFDQVARDVPFGALIQAFRSLVRQLLTESESRRERWRQDLYTALGSNAAVLTEVIPELEWIIGKQAPAPRLGATETQNRFQLVFRHLLQVLAKADHPLILFLDDLQWADSATLGLLEPLLTSIEIQYLLILGAYRDNEVDAGHPLTRALRRVETAGGAVHRIVLRPLDRKDVQLFVADILRRAPEDVDPLSRLVVKKTEGNPFFTIQFMKSLDQERLIVFNEESGHWTFHMEAIAAAPMMDNVIDLMTREIKRYPHPTQRALSLAACIGNEFDLETLTVVSGDGVPNLRDTLAGPLHRGLIVRAAGPQIGAAAGVSAEDEREFERYRFLHDRVQQVAYTLIPESNWAEVHLRVGRLLLASRAADSDKKLFEIIQHVNLGRDLVTGDDERLRFARLNVAAGRKAKSAAAYDAALSYFRAALDFLAERSWTEHYGTLFEVHVEEAECAFLCGRFEDAERSLDLLLRQAETAVDQAVVRHLRLVQYENRARYGDAVQCGREALALLAVSLPESETETQEALDAEVVAVERLIEGRPVASLANLPEMQDAEKRIVMRLLTATWAPAYITGNAVLARLISATIVRLSLEHGVTEESAYGYVTHAITVGPVLGNYQGAYEWGSLAISTDERFDNPKQRAKIHQQFHAHVSLWRRPFAEAVPHAREACRIGLEVGDFNYAAYGAFTESWASFLNCRSLDRFVQDQTSNLDLLKKIKMTDPHGSLMVMVNWARALRGQTAAPCSLTADDFDERAYAAAFGDRPFFMTPYYAIKAALHLVFENPDEALATAQQARNTVRALSGTIWPVFVDFLYAMAVTEMFGGADKEQRATWSAELSVIRESLGVLAESCPENFSCLHLLVTAEIHRAQGSDMEAMEAYERAIGSTSSAYVPWLRSWATERYAHFWRGRSNYSVAALYLAQAYRGYQEWGATAKTVYLERRHPELTPPVLEGFADSLDVGSLAKAARVVAKELEVEGVLKSLMRIALENAGAQRGFFLTASSGEPLIEAEQAVGDDEASVLQSVPLQTRDDLSHAILHYVLRTGETVVLGNAVLDERFAPDPYVAANPVLSVLCVPIVHHRRTEGVLYVENRLATEMFSPARTKVLEFIAAQAAISLENARLYELAKQEADERRRAEEALRSIVDGTAAVVGSDFFRSLVEHLARALGVPYAFVAECDSTRTKAQMLAFWKGDDLGANTEYEVAGTPCANVLVGDAVVHSSQVRHQFPTDLELVNLDAESYMGVPIRSAAGHVIGHLAILSREVLDEPDALLSVLKTFSARAGAEMDRLRAEDELRDAIEEVERLKNQLEAENVYLQEEIRREHNFEEIVGSSPVVLNLLAQVEQVAPTDATVLICGETGTGKELVARAIHDRSSRRERPLVKVNCGAISAGLVESELFGHVKGAFTGATERRVGRFELADGGTIFLDEVGELPLDTQVKLLRVLQEQEFEPVGSSRTHRVDVRVIAATNRDLEAAIRDGRFRADLFYRLNVLPLTVPALRDRRSDIPQLVSFFVSRSCKRFGKTIERVAEPTIRRLTDYAWPGNIRELQNVIERAVVLSSGSILALDEEFVPIRSGESAAKQGNLARAATVPLTPEATTAVPANQPTSTALKDVERTHIESVLLQTSWVIEGPKGAATLLGIHPNTLRSRLKKLGLRKADYEIS